MRIDRLTKLAALGIALASLLASSAARAQGVLEINQACAAGPGCFPGDTEGYPVQITGAAGASYRLTGDLRLAPPGAFDANTTAILISANRITLDLGGFEIVGPCSFGSCASGAGTGDGVSTSPFLEGIEVRNGTVSGMGRHGVLVGSSGVVRGVRVIGNLGAGIVAGEGSLVADNVSLRNQAQGILAGQGGRVSGNSSHFNNGAGIAIEPAFAEIPADGALVERNSVFKNVGDGIQVGRGARVSDNSVSTNQGNGIAAGPGCSIAGNDVFVNGVGPGGDDGIQAGAGSKVEGNTIRSNAGIGLVLAPGAAYAGNVISSNQVGAVSGSGANLGGNYCDVEPNACP
jgi:hypothetical protein